MPHAEFPEQHCRDQEPAGCQGQEHIQRRGTLPEDIQKRVVLDQRVRDDEGGKQQDLPAVDTDRIFAEFPRPVGEHIHELQPVEREKAQCCVDQKQCREHRGAARQHEDHRAYFAKVPCDTAFQDAVHKHDDSLYHPPDPGQFKSAAEHLDDLALRAHQDPVKITASDHARKGVEPSCDHLGKGKFQQDDRKAQQHLAVGEPLDGREPLKHKKDPQKHVERDEELSDRSE